MKITTTKLSRSAKENTRNQMICRQKANYERFIQGKAGVFQITEPKAQAMFWTMR